ncbi:enzymatic polyprotein [Penaeus vannamei]|uniref:Enzymatic polyprotein n=1 Tax=Penaeus vannamei TaxID=6689 RepID=A0A3R7LPF9_PENVA|nr:enzymatic polyprotein [Penaeus vannamei]
MLLVPKRQHGFRPVCDFRRLNKVTVPSPFPIPNLRQLLQDIGGDSKIFSSIDLAKGFLQVPLAEDSRPYTAFSTHVGHFEFLVSPMGLRNSPLTFSRLMALVLQGLINDQVLVYLDDILVCSPSIRDHEARLRSVFQRLSEAGLTINPAKCKFFQSRLDFLGHSISAAGIAPNEAKVKAVSMFPIPSDVTQPFIKDYGRIAAPLTYLLKKDVPWRWDEEQVNAFTKLKNCLSLAPVLAFPKFDLPFILHTDASNVGLGAVLMQEHKGNLRPVGFASRVLTSAEKNYSVTDREMLAIVWALKYFRDIILGYKVMVHTDHMPLTSLNGPRKCRRRHVVTRAIETSHPLRRDDAADFPPSFSLPSSAVVNSASQVPPLEPLHKDEVYAAQRADKRTPNAEIDQNELRVVGRSSGKSWWYRKKVSCDTLSGFTTSRSGNKHILVFVDNFSRYCELVAVPSKAAVHVTKAFNDVICCRHGCPQYLSSDNGTEFVNQVLASFAQQLNVTQANGVTERLNRSILTILRQLVDDSKDDWDALLPTVQSAINSTFHSSLGDSPHFLLTGQDKRLPYELLEMKPRPLYADNYANYLVSRQQQAFQQAKALLTRSRDRIIEYQHKIARAKNIGVGALDAVDHIPSGTPRGRRFSPPAA